MNAFLNGDDGDLFKVEVAAGHQQRPSSPNPPLGEQCRYRLCATWHVAVTSEPLLGWQFPSTAAPRGDGRNGVRRQPGLAIHDCWEAVGQG